MGRDYQTETDEVGEIREKLWNNIKNYYSYNSDQVEWDGELKLDYARIFNNINNFYYDNTWKIDNRKSQGLDGVSIIKSKKLKLHKRKNGLCLTTK